MGNLKTINKIQLKKPNKSLSLPINYNIPSSINNIHYNNIFFYKNSFILLKSLLNNYTTDFSKNNFYLLKIRFVKVIY